MEFSNDLHMTVLRITSRGGRLSRSGLTLMLTLAGIEQIQPFDPTGRHGLSRRLLYLLLRVTTDFVVGTVPYRSTLGSHSRMRHRARRLPSESSWGPRSTRVVQLRPSAGHS